MGLGDVKLRNEMHQNVKYGDRTDYPKFPLDLSADNSRIFRKMTSVYLNYGELQYTL